MHVAPTSLDPDGPSSTSHGDRPISAAVLTASLRGVTGALAKQAARADFRRAVSAVAASPDAEPSRSDINENR